MHVDWLQTAGSLFIAVVFTITQVVVVRKWESSLTNSGGED